MAQYMPKLRCQRKTADDWGEGRVSSFKCSDPNKFITATYFGSVHNCTVCEMGFPDLGLERTLLYVMQ
jgi:hypothetical protein